MVGFPYQFILLGGLISTCKRFHAVIIASKFLKKKCVGISFFDDIKEIKAMKKYRNVQNLIVRGIIDTRGYKNLFRDLRVLTFFGPIFKNPVEWRRVFGSLAHLENLAFERGKLSSSVIFETACKSNKFHLTEFKLDRIVIKSAAKESVIKFLKKHTSIRKLVIKVLKSFEEIWPLVVQDMSSLEHFEFSWNVFSLETIKKVNDVNLNIRQLTISGITEWEYQDEGNKLEEIIKRFPRVTRLVLLPRVYLENPKMQVIATHLPYLQDLDMYEFESDELVEFKGTFPNLQRLSINTWCLEDQTIENLEVCTILFLTGLLNLCSV